MNTWPWMSIRIFLQTEHLILLREKILTATLLLLFSHSVMSDSLWPHGLQHARLPCPSLSPRIGSNSCPLSQWCHPTISSSVVPFSSCLQSFPASGSFPMSQFFESSGQSIGVSASASVPQWIFRVDLLEDLLVWLFAVQETLKSLQHHNLKASILWHSAFFMIQLSPPYMTTGKTTALTKWTVVGKVVSLLFNMLSKSVIAFFPRSKNLLISRLQSLSAVILEPKKIKFVTAALK